MKGICGKGQVKCPSTVGVCSYTCIANGPFVSRNTPFLYFRPFVLATGKAVLLRFQHEGLLLMLTKKSSMAPVPSLCIVLLPMRGPTALMQQYGVEQVDWNRHVQLLPPKSFQLPNKNAEKQQPKVGVPDSSVGGASTCGLHHRLPAFMLAWCHWHIVTIGYTLHFCFHPCPPFFEPVIYGTFCVGRYWPGVVFLLRLLGAGLMLSLVCRHGWHPAS